MEIQQTELQAMRISFEADEKAFKFLDKNHDHLFRLEVLSWRGDSQTGTIRLVPDGGEHKSG